ncbi:DMT family transporter [Paenibacillus hodogayensis]|uniref:DMT family transporter n=1 Tax=Paenibacillus hodogayensis TaxID=279208 RepID=A0ABV5W2Y4_9BACL
METVLGLFFTLLWSSAAIATKFGLHSATPLALATSRFLLAGGLLLTYAYVFKRTYRWPRANEWGPLVVLGVLNTTLYLGATFWALNYVSAGLFNLFVTTNPFLVACLSYVWLKRRIAAREWLGMGVAAIGLLLATWPSILSGKATIGGFIVLGVGMASMAIGSVYFKKANIGLPSIVINAWQLSIGGIVTIPVAFMLEKETFVFRLDSYLAGSLIWLVFVISIGTMLLWFYLLRRDAVKANNWLFMTPIFGYMLAALFLDEAVTRFDLAATVFVITGLLLSGNIAFRRTDKRSKRP